MAGDFTGDGRTDLAVANEGDNTVSVLLGNGDGTFQPQVTYAVGLGPDAIVAGDFNGDGRTDLAVANGSDGTVSVLLGNGDGTFQPQVTYAVGQDPRRHRGRVTSTAMAAPTSPSPTRSATVSRSCWATATAPSRPGTLTRRGGTQRRLGCGRLHRRRPHRPGRRQLDWQRIEFLLGNGDGTFQNQVTNASWRDSPATS